MAYVFNTRHDTISYARQEHVPRFLNIRDEIHEKRNKRRGNSLQIPIGQRKQGMDYLAGKIDGEL